MSATSEKPETVSCECCPRDHERSGMPGAYDAAINDGWKCGWDGWICDRCNDGAETDPEAGEAIVCVDCSIEHPDSEEIGGRDKAVRDGWLIGDEGWYCLRCNAKDGEKVLH